MKITRIRLWHIALTSHVAYYMAGGKNCETVESVIIAVDTDDGLTGWGEVCPIPHYLPAYARGVAPALQELAPVLIGADPTGVGALMARIDAHLIGHAYAKSALDIAFWDLTGKLAGLPLYALFGGKRQGELPLYHSITCTDPDEMARMALEAGKTGITQFQAKLGASGDWSVDVERLTKIREAIGAGPLLYGDWNCGATSLDATRVGRAAAHLDVMLEQPCATLAECKRVREATGLAMKIDELAFDHASLLQAYELGIMDAVAIKTSKFGGLSKARQARDLCCHFGAKMCIEDSWGSDIVTAAALHLGASTEPARLMNVCDLSGYVAPRLDANAPSRKDGKIAPPEGAGLGVNIDSGELGAPDLILA